MERPTNPNRRQDMSTADLHYLPVYSSAGARRQAQRDRIDTMDRVRDRREDAARFLASGIDMLRHGIECGADKAALREMANTIADEIAKLDGQMRSALDNEGLLHQHRPLDTHELDVLRGRLA